MDYVFDIVIGLGFASGLLLGYLGARTVFRAIIRRSSHRRIIMAFVAAGSIAAVPVALFLAFVVGGNIGGGAGAFISESVNLGSIGAPIGISVGIAVILGVGVTLGAAIGGCIGHVVSIALRGKLAA